VSTLNFNNRESAWVRVVPAVYGRPASSERTATGRRGGDSAALSFEGGGGLRFPREAHNV